MALILTHLVLEPCKHTVVSYSNENFSFKWELPACLFLSFKKEGQWREDGCKIGHSHCNETLIWIEHYCNSCGLCYTSNLSFKQRKRFNLVFGVILKGPICPKSRWFYRRRISSSSTDVGRLVLASAERAEIQFRQKTSNPLLCGRSNYSGLREIRLDIS